MQEAKASAFGDVSPGSDEKMQKARTMNSVAVAMAVTIVNT